MAINLNQPQPGTNPKPKGTGFTNLQQYLQANRPEQLSGAVSQGIQGEATGTRQQLGQAKEQFGTESQKGMLGSDADIQARSGILQRATTTGQLEEKDPEAFKRFREGDYTGPQGLKNVGALAGRAQGAEQLGQAINSQGGRFGLLQRFLGGPQYTAGQQRFDELLLGTAGPTSLNEARRSTAGLGQEANREGRTAEEVAKSLQAKAGNFRTGTNEQLGQATGTLQGSLEQRAQAETQRLADKYGVDVNDLKANRVSPELAQRLGLPVGSETMDIDITQYLKALDAQNASTVASPEERARASALAKLGAQGTNPVIDVNVPQYDPNQDFGFDKEGFQSAVGNRKSAYDQAYKQVKNPFYTSGSGQFYSIGHGQYQPDAASAHKEISDYFANYAKQVAVNEQNGGAKSGLTPDELNTLASGNADPNLLAKLQNTVYGQNQIFGNDFLRLKKLNEGFDVLKSSYGANKKLGQ